MDDNAQDPSTYGAISAIVLFFVIIIVIAYQSISGFYIDHKEKEQDRIEKKIIFTDVPSDESILIEKDQHILYENLTNEEADEIIRELLKTGETNEQKIKKIESDISI